MLTPWRSAKVKPPSGVPCLLKVRHADGVVTLHKGPFEFHEGWWYRAKKPAGRAVLGEVVQWRLA